ncbi:MAG: hypothetical protein ACLRIS_02120 [Flavonifractor plautii]
MLTDVYSTAFQLTAESRTYTLGRLVEHGEKELTVREILETGMLAQEVSDAYVTIGAITQSRDGRRVTLTAEANVTVSTSRRTAPAPPSPGSSRPLPPGAA